MTVQSIREDIQNTMPKKKEQKPLGIRDMLYGTAELGAIFGNIMMTYDVENLLEEYKEELETYE